MFNICWSNNFKQMQNVNYLDDFFEIAQDLLEEKTKSSTAGAEEGRMILQRFQQNIATSLRMKCFIQREKCLFEIHEGV